MEKTSWLQIVQMQIKQLLNIRFEMLDICQKEYLNWQKFKADTIVNLAAILSAEESMPDAGRLVLTGRQIP